MIRFPASIAINLRRPLCSRFPVVTPASSRSASLSAIHRGLRRSERVQYGEARPRPSEERRGPKRREDYTDNRTAKALAGTGSSRAQHKLLKKRRNKDDDIETLTAKAAAAGSKRTEYRLLQKLRQKQREEDGTGPKSRRKRFMDPELDFGKKSLVYQLKQGPLQTLVNKIEKPVRPQISGEGGSWTGSARDGESSRRVSSDDFAERFAGRRDDTPRRGATRPSRSDVGQRGRGRESFRRDRAPSFSDAAPSRRSASDQQWGPTRFRTASFDRGVDTSARFGRKADETTRQSFDFATGEAQVLTPAPRERRGKLMPITIQYTTAASQFLYGKSVVTSALEQGRRKLYHLYIYGGENQQESKEKTAITRLAASRGVPITVVPQEDQRLMDKMSQGRPHNGFVLETSPLPQMPISALGSLVETPKKMGFHVSLDYQTKEDTEVNGEETFIRRSGSVNAKPFVLLLNEILDPGNLGGLLRTASYLGVDAVGITSRNSANLTPVVLKSAAGAVEEITIFSVASPVKFLEESKKAGWKSFAAIPPPDKKLLRKHGSKFISTEAIERQSPLSNDPCILVLGNEGYGLSKEIKLAADHELSFPRFVQESCVDSLNVSVVAGLLCHAFVRKPMTPTSATKGKPAVQSGAVDTDGTEASAEDDKLF